MPRGFHSGLVENEENVNRRSVLIAIQNAAADVKGVGNARKNIKNIA